MVINFGVKKLGCGESVGLVPFSAKYLKFSRQRDPHRRTDGLTDAHTLASRGLEELFYSCAVVSVFGSGGEQVLVLHTYVLRVQYSCCVVLVL
jgi:hypothetical protein